MKNNTKTPTILSDLPKIIIIYVRRNNKRRNYTGVRGVYLKEKFLLPTRMYRVIFKLRINSHHNITYTRVTIIFVYGEVIIKLIISVTRFYV